MAQSKRKANRQRPKKNKGGVDTKAAASSVVAIDTSSIFPICSIPDTIPTRFQTVTKNLRSHVALLRATSCSALSEMASSDLKIASELVSGGLVALVLPLILDANPGVALQAAGLLRNLAVLDSPAFGTAIGQLGVFDKLVQLLANQVAHNTEVADWRWNAHIVMMLVAITQHHDSAHYALIVNGTIWSLAPFALVASSPESSSSIVELFRNLIEESPELSHAIAANTTCMATLRSAMNADSSSLFTQAQIAGLFSDIAHVVVDISAELLAEIRGPLSRSLAVDLCQAHCALVNRTTTERMAIHAEVKRQFAAHVGGTIFQESINGKLAPEALDDSWQAAFQDFRDHVLAVQTSAESIVNLISTDDDEHSWPLEHIASLIGIDELLPCILTRISTAVVASDADDVSRDWERALGLLDDAMARCADCLTNLVMNGLVVQVESIVPTALAALCQHFERALPRPSLLEALGRLLTVTLMSPANVDSDQLSVMIQLASSSASEGVRQVYVAVLGTFAKGNPGQAALVAGTLLDRLTDLSPSVFLEAVNGIMDAFSDDDVHHATIGQIRLLARLTKLHDDDTRWDFRCSEDAELMDESSLARHNLAAFLKYRAMHP